MRHTQSRRDQLPPAGQDVSLAALECRRCGRAGCTVVCMGTDERGASSMAWCQPGCAMVDGWPGIPSEARRRRARSSPKAEAAA